VSISALSKRLESRTALGCAWLGLTGLFLWTNAHALALLPGDEGIYLYAGKLLTEGYWPQRDFFFAHPPLRVLLAGGLYGLGLPVVAPKVLALLAPPLAAGLLGLAVFRGGGIVGAVLTMVLYLFASLNLELAGVYCGPNLAATLLAGTLLASRQNRFGWAGALLALSGMQAYYALMPAPILALWAWRQGALWRFLLGLSAFFVFFAFFWLWIGAPFVENTLLYHLRKVTEVESSYPLSKLSGFLYTEAGLLIFGLAGVLSRSPTARWTAGVGVFCLAVPVLYRSLEPYYFMMSFPFLAVAGGDGYRGLVERARERGGRMPVAVSLLVGLTLVVTYLPHFLYGQEEDAVRALRAKETAALIEAVELHRTTSGLLFGDSSIVPLIALQTGLEVSERMVDMNAKRFDAGLITTEAVIASVYEGRRTGTVLMDHHGISTVDALRQHIRSNQVELFHFVGPAIGYEVRYLVPEEEVSEIARRLGHPTSSESRF